jgi:Type II site-specific deoxyribonuclease
VAEDRDQILSEITAGLEYLTHRQLQTVAAMVRSLHIPVEFVPAKASEIVDQRFAEEMANLLSLHHSNHEPPLNKKPFEYAMKQCLIAQGYLESDLNPKPGESTYDVYGNNERWSLKTEAAKGLSRNQVKIEKLSEARWVREATTAEACAIEVRQRIPHHMAGYDRILVLRAETRLDRFVYTLEEVPRSLLERAILSAEPGMFKKTDRGTKKGISFGADFLHPDNNDILFRMLLDSSVEKVRVWFQVKYCIHHGTWVVQRPAADVLTS